MKALQFKCIPFATYRMCRNFRIFQKSQAIFENIISKYFGGRFQNGYM